MEQSKATSEPTNETSSNGKTIGTVAYLTLIGLVVAFVMNSEKKDEFATYHIRQSLGLCVCGLALFVVGLIPILGWIISMLGTLVIIYMWIVGLMNALNNKMKPVPLLGEKFREWFKNL